jgi:hypothetical protein
MTGSPIIAGCRGPAVFIHDLSTQSRNPASYLSQDCQQQFQASRMVSMKLRILLLFTMGITGSALALPFPARATLGGDLTSVHDDQMKMRGTLRTTSKDSYNVHEIQAANGIVLREYVSPSGSVFGVAWQGRSHPDLRQVFGAYYDRYVQAVHAQRAQRHGHGPLLLQQPDLVVQMSGHMRSLAGKAFLPQGLPAGVHAEEIR